MHGTERAAAPASRPGGGVPLSGGGSPLDDDDDDASVPASGPEPDDDDVLSPPPKLLHATTINVPTEATVIPTMAARTLLTRRVSGGAPGIAFVFEGIYEVVVVVEVEAAHELFAERDAADAIS